MEEGAYSKVTGMCKTERAEHWFENAALLDTGGVAMDPNPMIRLEHNQGPRLRAQVLDLDKLGSNPISAI